MKYNFLYTLGILLILSSCGAKKGSLSRLMTESSADYFSGFVVYNPTTRDTLLSFNAEKFFTPASTVKLFTLYAALRVLPDTIATFSYLETKERLYFKPLADPSFLHDSLPNSSYDFLLNNKKDLLLVPDKFPDFVYGNGWQWDDFQYYYMPEKSLFPIYGNLATINVNKVVPKFFQVNLKEKHPLGFSREFDQNVFYKDSSEIKKRVIPFKTSLELSRELLSDTLHRPVYIAREIEDGEFKPYKSTPTLPIYKQLMAESENFIAEQLFLIIGKDKTNTYKVENAINYVLDSLLLDIPNKPRWVDASGLSRYNLFTPKSMVYLLDKMYKEYGEEKMRELLPENGENGGLQKWYPFSTPYLFAKTGLLSNNYNMCGYLKTKKGNLLIFSYMNNNYRQETATIRKRMNQVLQKFYNEY